MKTYSEWLELKEARWSVRNELEADTNALRKVYRETREEGPAATVAAFVAAVGYNRAAVVISTLVNRHGWDGRISRRAVAWAAAVEGSWSEEAARHFGIYIDDVIHLAHFDQIAREFMKTTPPEDPDERPETISADEAAPETPETISAGTEAAQAEAEAPEAPEAVAVPETVALAPEAFRAVVEAAPRCGLLFDLQGDCLRYKTEDGRKRCIYTEAVTVEHGDRMARIKYRNGSSRGQITLEAEHACFPVAAVVAGTVPPSEALWKIEKKLAAARSVTEADAAYFRGRKKSGKRADDMKENVKLASTWADQAACIIKNAADGIPMFIEQIAAELEAVAAAANETGLAAAPAKHLEAVAVWIRETVAACWKAAREALETAAERPETISAGSPAAQAEPEAQEAPAAPEAPAEPEQDPGAVILVETTFDMRNGGSSTRRVLYTPGKGLETIPEKPEAVTVQPEPVPEKKPEAGRKYAAYYADFPDEARIFTAANKKEAETEARKYRRAWSLPALLRVDSLTEEEAARKEAEARKKWSFLYKDEQKAVPAPEAVQPAPEAQEAPQAVAAVQPEPVPEKKPEAPEAAAERPETISAGSPAAQAAPEARSRRQAPEKPARGPGKPLDFIGQTLSGNGWQIVFDTGLQRTRVIIEEAAREKAAPLAEAAGFYYSVNTDSWHKKLSHKAHRAAEALAEKLRAAC